MQSGQIESKPVTINPLRVLLVSLLLVLAFILSPERVQAANTVFIQGESLCLPGLPILTPTDCLHLGPADYINQMAEAGILLPLQALPGIPPDKQLVQVPQFYAKIISGRNAPAYASLEDAIDGRPILYRIEQGFDFITYIDRTIVDGYAYFMIDPGIWMRGSDLSRISAMPSFQGLEFHQTPNHAFGWVLFETQSKRSPGFESNNFTGRFYSRYEIVQIYAVEETADQNWFLIGPNEWVEGRLVAGVFPNPTPPEGVDNGRWVEVNLAEQTASIYAEGHLQFATVMSSGIPGQWTRPGLFQAYQKKESETMSGSFTVDRSDYYYLEGVPWTVYFDQARALHGTYWHNGFGVPRSRGCVNFSPGDAHWIFNWIQEGDWIYVWDPSGETPTDPSLYTAGGA